MVYVKRLELMSEEELQAEIARVATDLDHAEIEARRARFMLSKAIEEKDRRKKIREGSRV